ncbi:MAG TPA: DNA polymerase III subunit beta [Lachnospiraceae bacterium]|nr:DNA polymerase III subunit beta [Lachnospiraceae bacterium]
MKLTCDRNTLLNGINIVSKAVSNRTTLPILECILLKTYDDGFKMTGTDLELGIKTALIDAEIEKPGSVALEAKIFFDIIRRVEGETVCITCDDNNAVILSCGKSEFKIMGQSGDDFPEIPTVEQSFAYTLKQKDLREMITETIFSIALDESKPQLTGELIEINGNQINIVAVDGYRISYKRALVSETKIPVKVIVPGKTLKEISKILSQDEDNVDLYITDKHILFDLQGNIIVSRLIDGDFIKYDQTFTEEFKTRVISDRADLIASLERASLISRDARKVPVKIDIQSDKMIITSQTEMGAAYEEIKIDAEGDTLKIAFNPKYLIDALRAIEDDKISMQFNTALSPCIIKPEEGDIYKYLVLPLRI